MSLLASSKSHELEKRKCDSDGRGDTGVWEPKGSSTVFDAPAAGTPCVRRGGARSDGVAACRACTLTGPPNVPLALAAWSDSKYGPVRGTDQRVPSVLFHCVRSHGGVFARGATRIKTRRNNQCSVPFPPHAPCAIPASRAAAPHAQRHCRGCPLPHHGDSAPQRLAIVASPHERAPSSVSQGPPFRLPSAPPLTRAWPSAASATLAVLSVRRSCRPEAWLTTLPSPTTRSGCG